jgi:double-strand break repair protein MRE11
MPEDSVLAAMEIDNIKVEKLVHEFLTAQSLKILPQAPFGDAVREFVVRDDKHAMETFVDESLTTQVKELLLADEDEEEELESVMDRIRAKQEALFEAGVLKRPTKKGKLKPQPQHWDTDEDGPWAAQPGAFEPSGDEDDGDGTPAPAGRRQRPSTLISDDDISRFSGPTKKAAAKKAPAKKAPAKAPARGRKKVVAEPSDDEDNDSDGMIMDGPPSAKSRPKSQPKRAAAVKGRQTQLNFSQSQAKTSTARELSDDEISDDDDAFEPMPSKRR